MPSVQNSELLREKSLVMLFYKKAEIFKFLFYL